MGHLKGMRILFLVPQVEIAHFATVGVTSVEVVFVFPTKRLPHHDGQCFRQSDGISGARCLTSLAATAIPDSGFCVCRNFNMKYRALMAVHTCMCVCAYVYINIHGYVCILMYLLLDNLIIAYKICSRMALWMFTRVRT